MATYTGSVFFIKSARAVGLATVRVTLTKAPKVSDPADPQSALNPTNWTVSGGSANYVTHVGTVDGVALELDLFLASPLPRGQWTLAAQNIVQLSDNTLIGPNTAVFTVSSAVTQTPLAGGTSNDSVANVFRKLLNPALRGENWDSVIEALSAGDAINWDNAKLAFNQLFLSTASGKYLEQRAGDVGQRRPAGLSLTDEAFRRLAVITKTRKLTQEAILEVLEVFYGRDAVRASMVTSVNEPYLIDPDDRLVLKIDERQTVTVAFGQTGYARGRSYSALEVAAAITRACKDSGSQAFAISETDPATGLGRVRVYGAGLGLSSSVRVIGGRAQNALLFPNSLFMKVARPAAPPFAPTDLAGLKLYLRADQGVTQSGGLVSAWADQSGHGNHATQATGANQPTWNGASFNGHPGITFGPNLSLGGTSNLITAGGARTIFVACKATSGSEGGSLLVFRTAGNRYALQIFNAGVSGTIYTWTDCTTVNAQNSLTPTDINGTSNIIMASFDGNVNVSLQQMKLNGVTKAASGSAVKADNGTAGFTVGMRLDNPTHECFFGVIATVLVYDSVLSVGDYTNVANFLKELNGL